MSYIKFHQGEYLTPKELRELSLIDRIRYVVANHEDEVRQNPIEIYQKLKKLNAISKYVTVIDVADLVREFYG